MNPGTFVGGVLLAAVACAASVVAWGGSAAEEVQVVDPYVRAVPPGQPNSGSFMLLKNIGTIGHAVVGARSPAAAVVELHTHVNEGGMMKMRPVERFDIAAGGETELKPGGYHVMLIGLTGDLVPGEEIGITLTFDDGSEETVQATVRKLQMMMQPMKH